MKQCDIIILLCIEGSVYQFTSFNVLGNSSRCLQFCEELVERFNFHHFDNLNHAERKIDPRRSRHEVCFEIN